VFVCAPNSKLAYTYYPYRPLISTLSWAVTSGHLHPKLHHRTMTFLLETFRCLLAVPMTAERLCRECVPCRRLEFLQILEAA
jgi:hypothetical protein